MMIGGIEDQIEAYDAIRKLKLPNSIAPAFIFDPLPPGAKVDITKQEPRWSETSATQPPANIEDLAFATVRELAELLRTRKITSLALTKMYLARLKRYDPNCISSSLSPKTEPSPRPKPQTPRSPPANTVARFTAFPGAPRICSP